MTEEMPEELFIAIHCGTYICPAWSKDENAVRYIRADPDTVTIKRSDLEIVKNILFDARMELHGCHSNCDPETSMESDAVSYRECLEAIKIIEVTLKGE